MTKRVFALWPLALLTELQAASLTPIDDGCDRLRDIVISQVAALSAGSREPALLREAKGQPVVPDPPDYCMDTAAATTAAFTSALHAEGIPVGWGAEGGDYCGSRSLPQCYPRPVYGDLATARQLGFLHDAWKAISTGVAASMPYGTSSDMAVFDANELVLSIRRGHRPKDQRIIRSKSPFPQE
ncbi:MAG: hypothetical protein OEW68_08855 [Gammaproteobacteria bacterium]|nr:hypothetical protein [Gammaproteobacteria bacterium]MDH4314936.1 hypothetical protein [Gammaproteobacteria bacterium]MDH5214183.1 hypothetical protein [Gammaproteobacteria bacterium]MDH5500874.1 hypothetical protein [Gammaproteobacteria bacterium]